MIISQREFELDYEVMTYEQLMDKYKIKRYQVAEIVKKLNLSKKVGRKKEVEIILE